MEARQFRSSFLDPFVGPNILLNFGRQRAERDRLGERIVRRVVIWGVVSSELFFHVDGFAGVCVRDAGWGSAVVVCEVAAFDLPLMSGWLAGEPLVYQCLLIPSFGMKGTVHTLGI